LGEVDGELTGDALPAVWKMTLLGIFVIFLLVKAPSGVFRISISIIWILDNKNPTLSGFLDSAAGFYTVKAYFPKCPSTFVISGEDKAQVVLSFGTSGREVSWNITFSRVSKILRIRCRDNC
jgi:hypothetical protein